MSAAVLEARVGVALREFDVTLELEVRAGRCLALVGPSGAGKSTVLRTIAGLRRPESGHIALDTELWFESDSGVDIAPERRNCGYVFQEYALFPHLSALRNVAFGVNGSDRVENRRRALELLERFEIAELADALPARLSGGERQRVALARALAPRPRVLLLDEPLSALDARTRAEAGRRLSATLADLDVPVVLVTHDFAEAATLAGEIAVIDRGHLVQRGPASELSGRPASAFVADFAGASVLRGVAGTGEAGLTVVDLEHGGTITSTEHGRGAVAVAVYPWEVTLEPLTSAHYSSALNRLVAEVVSVTEIGNRARVALTLPQPLAAEVTAESATRLGLAPGVLVAAVFKATATRLVQL